MIARPIAVSKPATSLALALALVAMGQSAPAQARAPGHAKPEAVDAALAKGDAARGIDLAEAAVEHAPHDGAARAALGRAYLKAGRFASAATALGDAVALGEMGGRTLLALGLAQVANGQNGAAVASLDKGGATIPAGDLGLALTLAGEGARGTGILADAVRAGDHSEKLRANLAYAYALEGRWDEARALVAVDLPADQVDARMTDWAHAARPQAARERVAALLGVSMKEDAGMPAKLALVSPAGGAAPVMAVAEPVGELPPVGDAAVSAPAHGALVFHAVAPAVGAKAVHAKPVKLAAAGPVAPRRAARKTSGHHAAQLGAFLSEHNALAARSQALAQDKSLAAADVVISKAVVGGRSFWRVSVAGLDAGSAASRCGQIRKSGGACFARLEDGAVGAPNAAGQALALATPDKARRGQ